MSFHSLLYSFPPAATACSDRHSRSLYPPTAMPHLRFTQSFDDDSPASSCPSSPSLAPCPLFAVDDDLGLVFASAPQVVPHPRFWFSSGVREGIRSIPLPGVRCPKCAKDGKEVWVIPGRACGYCGTACC